MEKQKKTAAKKKTGQGYLFVRTADGKEKKPGKGIKGSYWLQYQAPTGQIDPITDRPITKRKKVRLLNEDGTPITKLTEAEQARGRITSQYLVGSKKDRLMRLKAEIEQVETEETEAYDLANPPTKIKEAWDTFASSPEGPQCGADTLSRYKTYWTHFQQWMKSQHPQLQFLREITTKHAQEYAVHLSNKNGSPNTYNKHVSLLKLLHKTLKEEARLELNPFERIKPKRLNNQNRRELSIEELHRVLDTATDELKTLLAIGTFTGLRLGDCCTLLWGEVDLKRGVISRVPSKTKSRKADAKPVKIGIPSALKEILSKVPSDERIGYVLSGYAEQYLYRSSSGAPSKQPIITCEVQAHFEACGISTHKAGTGYKLVPDPADKTKLIKQHTGKRAVVEVGFHSLRHTYVSLQAESGTPQAVVQAIVGHGSPAMTSHYTHIGEEAAKQAALTFDTMKHEIDTDSIDCIHSKLAEMNADNWEVIRDEILRKSNISS